VRLAILNALLSFDKTLAVAAFLVLKAQLARLHETGIANWTDRPFPEKIRKRR
jgi:hypothetical protein